MPKMPKINKFIKDTYYKKSKKTKKPVVFTGRKAGLKVPPKKQEYLVINTPEYEAKAEKLAYDFFNKNPKFKEFPVQEIDVPTASLAREAFDKVKYPLKIIVPKNMWNELGVREVVPKYIKGKKNAVRYYTKNKTLTQYQCDILYREENIRSTHSYFINDSLMSTEMLLDYLKKIQKYEDINAIISDTDGEVSLPRSRQALGQLFRTYKAMQEIAPKVQTNPDGSREPQYIGMGIKSKMEMHGINNPTGLIEAQAKAEKEEEKYKVPSYDILGRVLNEINVLPQEAFDYICSYINRYKDIKRKHVQFRESERGGSALKILVDFFKARKEETTLMRLKDNKTKVYTYKNLMESQEYENYCNTVNETKITKYNTFKDWFKATKDRLEAIQNKKK